MVIPKRAATRVIRICSELTNHLNGMGFAGRDFQALLDGNGYRFVARLHFGNAQEVPDRCLNRVFLSFHG